jgi:hypothetical protein
MTMMTLLLRALAITNARNVVLGRSLLEPEILFVPEVMRILSKLELVGPRTRSCNPISATHVDWNVVLMCSINPCERFDVAAAFSANFTAENHSSSTKHIRRLRKVSALDHDLTLI